MVELYSKILHTHFEDYAQSFCQLCANYVRQFSGLYATYFSYLKIKSLLN